MIDRSHDPARRSWVESAEAHADFPIQNLPLGIFDAGEGRRPGVAIGDRILDLAALKAAGLVEETVPEGDRLNDFLALGAHPRTALRHRVGALLEQGAVERASVAACLRPAADCRMALPVRIGDYTDFYAGINHALNVGRLFRPDAPLPPNYRHVPIGYHGRASTVRPSGEAVRRPHGQRRKSPDAAEPVFGPSISLDFELELGIWIGPGNARGEPIPIARAAEHIAGFSLLNDWSARDIQAWEYQPLGPFLAKSFHTTVSPWIVTPEALAPFRRAPCPRGEGEPQPLPYLGDPGDAAAGAIDLDLEVLLSTAAMRKAGLGPQVVTRSNALDLYWTVAQMVAHHASNGCALEPGDLLGSGTISGTGPGSFGSLLEITRGGREAVTLPSGETRTYLADGDEVTLRATARREGFRPIGFGACTATIVG